MRRVTRARQQDGAVTVIVAVLVPVLLLVVGGVVITVGSWYSSRAQAQNGADAGAQAVALSCAKGACDLSGATAYATANANSISDIAVNAGFPCGHDSNAGGAHLPACSPSVENGTVCPASHPTNYVNVQTITTNDVGLLGSLAGEKTKVAACAQAAWGPAGSCGACVPFTISDCEWQANTAGGTKFATPYSSANPVYPPSYLATLGTRRATAIYDTTAGVASTNYYTANSIQDPFTPPRNAPIGGSETVLDGHGFGDVCKSNSGQNSPGQFGWLGKGGDPCSVSIDNGLYTGSTGTPPPSCKTIFETSRNNQTPIFMPVFSSSTGTGSNVTYTLEGFAGFVITGWGNLNGGSGDLKSDPDQPSVITQNDSALKANLESHVTPLAKADKAFADDATYCGAFTGDTGNSTQCIYGYFTQALIPASDLPGGGGSGSPNLGAIAPYLTG